MRVIVTLVEEKGGSLTASKVRSEFVLDLA